ncbi:MAG: hypothetical protein AAF494_08905 [Pseudomonadota bacterium]
MRYCEKVAEQDSPGIGDCLSYDPPPKMQAVRLAVMRTNNPMTTAPAWLGGGG